MSEVNRDPQQTIHEDYGTLFATDYVLLMCYVVWMICMHHANIHAYLVTPPSLRITEIPSQSSIAAFTFLGTIVWSLSQELSDQNVRSSSISDFCI